MTCMRVEAARESPDVPMMTDEGIPEGRGGESEMERDKVQHAWGVLVQQKVFEIIVICSRWLVWG